MLPPPPKPHLFRSATIKVDLKAGEIRRDGQCIRLQEQPLQVLRMLVEHAGDVVTRDELRHHLWPDDTFVDFDQGLNKAINKIRKALGDSAEKPRYIETFNKRGYRLLAALHQDGVDPQLSGSENPTALPGEERNGGRAGRLWRRMIALWGAPALRTVVLLVSLAESLPD